MPVYSYFTFPASREPKTGRPHRDRKKIKESRKANRRRRR